MIIAVVRLGGDDRPFALLNRRLHEKVPDGESLRPKLVRTSLPIFVVEGFYLLLTMWTSSRLTFARRTMSRSITRARDCWRSCFRYFAIAGRRHTNSANRCLRRPAAARSFSARRALDILASLRLRRDPRFRQAASSCLARIPSGYGVMSSSRSDCWRAPRSGRRRRSTCRSADMRRYAIASHQSALCVIIRASELKARPGLARGRNHDVLGGEEAVVNLGLT